LSTKRLRQEIGMLETQEESGVDTFDAISRGAWPSGKVFYTFARSFSSSGRRVVQQAIQELQSKTCVRLEPRTSQRNYIQFFHGSGCYSMIGQQGGRQQVSLASPGCLTKGVAVHEILHAIGFYHEQSRRDRDSYIRINWNNINRRMHYNFKMYRQGQASTLGEPYDKKSVMHYGNYAFSINGRKTIESVSNSNEKLGQRYGLSAIDVKQIKKYYKCDGTTTVVTSRPTTTGRDLYPFCKVLKDANFCSNNWVTRNCKKSCQKTIVTTKAPTRACVDKSRYCATWAGYGYCKRGIYKSYMLGNCRKSCNLTC